METSISKHIIHILIISLAILFVACDDSTDPEDDVNYDIIEPLTNVVKRDLLVFNDNTIPDTVINSLTNYKAIVFGELHTIAEERELVSNLAAKLSMAGIVIEICAECPQAYSWVYEKVSLGELSSLPGWVNYPRMLPILDSLTRYNASTQNKIKLRCIDRNDKVSTFYSSLKGFVEMVNDNAELVNYINNFPDYNSNDYIDSIYAFRVILNDNPAAIGLLQTDEHYLILSQMVENEIKSIGIRANWSSDYQTSFSNREDLIKSNADYCLAQSEGTIIFYFGSYHAQKERFMGSNIEWLGDYLHNSNPISTNKSISIVGVPLKGEIINSSNTGTTNFNLLYESKADDLFRITADVNSRNYSMLFLSDPIFLESNIRTRYVYKSSEVVIPTKKQYDAFIFIPKGTYSGR